ncbi:hypothetical protein [Bacillus fonticola]|uniref:hypothetical protein n=1 Tax=Bacillus fonticola TaxID=2728853 RepID=UPI001474FA92|nr:hypothetical protein [Bacillus fonticola]
MKLFRTMSIVLMLTISVGIIVGSNHSEAVSDPALLRAFPDGEEKTYVSSQYVYEFNSDIVDVNNFGIRLNKEKPWKRIPLEDIRFEDQFLIITPEDPLEFDETYELTIPAYSIELENGKYKQEIEDTFSTETTTLNTLFSKKEYVLQQYLDKASTKDLYFTTPKRYIKAIEIQQKSKDDTAGLTNIDIFVSDSNEINDVQVEIISNGEVLWRRNANATREEDGTVVFSQGFTDMPSIYDVRVRVLDRDRSFHDEVTLKVFEPDEKFNYIEESFDYETTSQTFSLNELIREPDLFEQFLAENSLSRVVVQIGKNKQN